MIARWYLLFSFARLFVASAFASTVNCSDPSIEGKDARLPKQCAASDSPPPPRVRLEVSRPHNPCAEGGGWVELYSVACCGSDESTH